MEKNVRTPNAEQLEAINTTDGPVLIIAGPGSGKTFTLVERVYNLLVNKKVAPENILVSTFTEKAARELVTRISNRIYSDGLSININNLCVGTLHSIFLNLLEEFRDYTRLKRNYSIWDQFDQQYMIYKNIHRFRHTDDSYEVIGNGGWWKQAGVIASWVNKVSEEALSIEQMEESDIPAVGKLADIYGIYEEILDEQNALDFSKIQYEFLTLIENNPEVLETLRARYKYMMIDEYQDTNSIQERIILKLLNPDQNICVVGDDDQGLYRFRGATIRNILEFENNFNGRCKRVELTKNYRSHSGIIDFYNDWMNQQDWTGDQGNVQYRFAKKVVADPDKSKNEADYRSVMTVSAEGTEAWCDEVTDFINEMRRQSIITDLNQIVFLFRSVQNNHAVALAHHLEEKGIRVYSPRSNMFFQRKEIKLAVGAICTVYANYFAENDFNPEYKQYIESCIADFKQELRSDDELRSFIRDRLMAHSMIQSQTLDYALSGLFYQLLQFDLFAQYLGDRAQSGLYDSRPARNLAKFTQMLTKFEYLENITVFTAGNIEHALKKFYVNYLCFLYDGGIEEYEDDVEYAPSGFVSFMTVHQSKGLEFPVVFVCSLWDTPRKQYTGLDEILQNEFYHKKPFEPIEETKYYDFMRLYYTAYSRAQNLLCLSCPEQSTGRNIPSKMFRESYRPLINWRIVQKSELAKIKLDKIKLSNMKNEYAFTSHIVMYETCPMQYKFFKELGFAPVRQGSIVFGTLVHQTIEDIHKAVIRGKEESITEENIATWLNKNYENIVKKEHLFLNEGVRKSALKQVIQYAEHEKDNWSRIKEAEVDVSFMEQDYILRGKIDLIRNDNGHIDIVDFKAEKKPDINASAGREHLDRYKRQLQIYAHIIEQRYGEKVDNMHLYYTNSSGDENPYITFPRNDLAIARTIDHITDVVHKIESKDYSMSERKEKHCNECDMRAYCQKHWCPKD